MIDKSRWKTRVEKQGNIIAIYFTGGGECLWLNMYLDTEHWQMTCDSDIGAMLTSTIDLHDYGSRGLYGKTWIAYRRPPEGEE